MNTDTDWTDDTVARLRALWAEGHSTAEIGRRMAITKNAVVGKAHRLDLPGRPSPIRRGAKPQPRPQTQRIKGPTLPPLATSAPSPAAAVPERAAAPVDRFQPAPRVGKQPCCWPIGEPGKPGFRFCADPALHNKPYCAAHAAVSYVPVRDARNRVDGPSFDWSLRRLAG